MGTKITTTTLTGQYASVAALNANFALLADEFDKVVYRTGLAPNFWQASQDANSNRLINLPAPTSNTEPIRVADAVEITDGHPSVTTDKAIARYIGSAGLLGNSGVIISEANDLSGIVALTMVGTLSNTGSTLLRDVTIGGGVAASELRLLEPSGSGAHYAAFKAQAMAANVVWTLPAADGASLQVLQTNGAGVLSWATLLLAHGTLTGLANDDHTQYALLTGRAGGQTLIAGLNPGDQMIIRGSADAAGGNILIQPTPTITALTISQVGDFVSEVNRGADRMFRFRNTSAGPNAGCFFQLAHNSTTTADVSFMFSPDNLGSFPWTIGMDGSDSQAWVFSNGSALGTNNRFRLSTAGDLLIGSGSVTTAAPAGGTAAPWRFGVVSVTSPTSPNRTIELDVNGTLYFVHAKTTNN